MRVNVTGSHTTLSGTVLQNPAALPRGRAVGLCTADRLAMVVLQKRNLDALLVGIV